MVGVAVMSIASVLWASWMNRRASYCQSQAEWHANQQSHLSKNRDYQLSVAGRTKDPALASYLRYDAERYRQGIIWHARREMDYRRAMWRLWEPSPNFARHAPWPSIPANLLPAGADPSDLWITTDGHWGTRAQISDRAPLSGQ